MEALTVRQALVASGLVPLEAQVLLAHALGKDRAWLVGHRDDVLPQKEIADFLAMARKRREQGEPIAYLVGRREFHGLDLEVTRDVLIPRPETETLVETALAAIDARAIGAAGTPAGGAAAGVASGDASKATQRILDLGTGSGAIALAIAAARPHSHVTAVDRSDAALKVARANAARLGLANVELLESDWYQGVSDRVFDVIVANPPYIAGDDEHLGQGDLRFEPREALTPGGDGLSALRRIVHDAPRHLAPQGFLAVEHGYDQGEAVKALFADAGFERIAAARDLAGIPRVVSGVLQDAQRR